jgi:hypothetical protein
LPDGLSEEFGGQFPEQFADVDAPALGLQCVANGRPNDKAAISGDPA